MRVWKVKRAGKKPLIDTKAVREKQRRHGLTQIEMYAEHLRKHPTRSEQLFCDLLDRLRIPYEFQPVICGYIPDFYFPQYGRRIIELDGKIHREREQMLHDRKRDARLRKAGHRIMRISSSRVFWDTDGLIERIHSFLNGQRRKGAPKKQKRKRDRWRANEPDVMMAEFMFATEGI